MKSKKLKMNVKIVANNLEDIQRCLKFLSERKDLKSNCFCEGDGVKYDYDFVISDSVFSKDSRKKVVNPNERSNKRHF